MYNIESDSILTNSANNLYFNTLNRHYYNRLNVEKCYGMSGKFKKVIAIDNDTKEELFEIIFSKVSTTINILIKKDI